MNYDNWLFDYILFVMCCLMVVVGAFMSPDEHMAIDIMILILMAHSNAWISTWRLN